MNAIRSFFVCFSHMDMEPKLFLIGIVILGAALLTRRFKGAFKQDKAKKIYSEILEWLDTGAWAVLMASVIMFFLIQAFKIPSGSMKSTLDIGDHLFVNKFVYGIRVPFSDKKIMPLRRIQRGDIVVFKFPAKNKQDMHYGKDFIKRVIGLPGEKFEIKNKIIYINDEPIKEHYIQHVDPRVYPGQIPFFNKEEYQREWASGGFSEVSPMYIRDNFGPVILPEGEYMALGDNRDASFDSRFWGPLEFSKIKGKPLIIYWPLTRIRIIR